MGVTSVYNAVMNEIKTATVTTAQIQTLAAALTEATMNGTLTRRSVQLTRQGNLQGDNDGLIAATAEMIAQHLGVTL